MFTIIIVVLIILALGGFGHTGYSQGWYGSRPAMGGGNWFGGILGIVLVIVLLFLVFGGGQTYFGPGTATTP